MKVRIYLTWTAEVHELEPAKHEVSGIEIWMLSGQYESWLNASIDEGVYDRG